MASEGPVRALVAGRYADLILPVAIVSAVLVIVVPLPAALLDVLLAANLTLAVIVLLTTISVARPLEFSVFPSVLLATTLSRLVLNFASTRLILSRAGTDGLDAAGGVIQGFGNFVAGDRVLVGAVLFTILVVIQFVVITKGATRISEVAARFALDGLPGRQMAIDADLAAGAIDEHEAHRRRDELTRQADFYGAMDGASKFVRGDAIAGLVITLVNVVGGLAIGITEFGLGARQAGDLYTRLTIGDGLVSQLPALLIALAAGLLVTRSTQSSNLSRSVLDQLFARPQTLALAGGFAALLVLTRLPAAPLLLIGGSCMGLSFVLARPAPATEENDSQPANGAGAAQGVDTAPRLEDHLRVDPLKVEIGVGLVRLADPGHGGDLLDQIARVRESIAGELGILMPKVRIRDNMQLPRTSYRVSIDDVAVADGQLDPLGRLVVDPGHRPTSAQPFGAGARWVEPVEAADSEARGAVVLTPTATLARHLQAIVRGRADVILTRDAVRHLIDEVRGTAPAAVDELIPNILSLAEVQQVLGLLLRENVPIRPLAKVLEAVGDHAAQTRDPRQLAEHVRERMGPMLTSRYRDGEGRLRVVTIEPTLEDRMANADARPLSSADSSRVCDAIQPALDPLIREGLPPLLLVRSAARRTVHELVEGRLRDAVEVIVLGDRELSRDARVESVGTVRASIADSFDDDATRDDGTRHDT